jgi:molecular chaperone GrpE
MTEQEQHRTVPGESSRPAANRSDAGPTGDGVTVGGADETGELRAELARMEDRWRRALADFDNLRKRVARESAGQREDERAAVAARWLPVLDNLELALQHAAADPASIVSGVRAVHEQALGILADLGFPRRSDVNEPFDPSRHEVVATMPDAEAEPGTVLQVVRPGYGSDERPLRPAAVIVAKGT